MDFRKMYQHEPMKNFQNRNCHARVIFVCISTFHLNPILVGIFSSLKLKYNENFEPFFWTQDTKGINVTKCTASWEPLDVSFQSNKDLKKGGDHFMPPPPYQKYQLNRSTAMLGQKNEYPINQPYRDCDSFLFCLIFKTFQLQ